MSLLDDILARRTLNAPRVIAKSKLHAWMSYSNSLLPFLEQPYLKACIPAVAMYYFEGTPKEEWDLDSREDFPDLTPPLPVIWFEYPFPTKIRSETGDKVFPAFVRDGRVGVIMMRADRGNIKGEDIPAEAKYILHFDLFLDYGARVGIQGPHFPTFIAIDEAGAMLGNLTMHAFTEPDDDKANEIVSNLVSYIHPPLLALSWFPRELAEGTTEINL